MTRSEARLSHGRAVMARLDELALFSAHPDRLTRLYLTPEHRQAAEAVRLWMEQAGMAATMDAVGNVVGRYRARRDDAPTLILGSHIDTVRDAGKYDGNFGVAAAIEAVAALHEAGTRLDAAIEVIAFGDEEGVRFPVALTGSRAVAGTLDAGRLDVRDADGITLRAALEGFGLDPAQATGLGRRAADVRAYLELHIEQGPVLEAENLPLGVVTAIAGASRFQFTITGVAGHAGTVPMGLRHDALAATAEMVLAIEQIGIAGAGRDLVATVGQCVASPGAVNVIPGETRFSIDVRAPDDAVRLDAVRRILDAVETIAARRTVRAESVQIYDASAVTCAPWIANQIAAAVQRAGLPVRHLPSGAGHDGLAMAALCPVGMLFVRCKGGISHNPAEAITENDAGIAVCVLLDLLRTIRFP